MAGKQRIYKALLLFISVCFSVLVCEVVLTIISAEEYYVWQPGLKVITKPQPGTMPGISGENLFFINSYGIRGDPFYEDHDYRFLAIGGSTTECFYLDETEAWPHLVQEILNRNLEQNVWVGNVGRSAHKSKHHIVQVQKLLKQYPRIDAILLLVGINDLDQRVAKDDKYKPFPPFDSLTPRQYNSLLTEAFVIVPQDSRSELPFYRRTEIEYRLRKLLWLFMNREHNQDKAGRLYIKRREFRKNASSMRAKLPDLSSALEEYTRNLNTIIDLANQSATRTIFITQPTMWIHDLDEMMQDLLWFGGLGYYIKGGAEEYYSVAALADGIKKYNQTLMGVCKSRNVEYIDLAAVLPPDTTVFYDDCHFNESGSKKVAQVVADYLLQNTAWTKHTTKIRE